MPNSSLQVSVIFLLTTALSIATIQTAHADDDAMVRRKAAGAETLLAKAATAKGVRVIVTLKGANGAPLSAQGSSSVEQTAAARSDGPLRDGQAATVEQSQILARHLGQDGNKRARWATRLIGNSPHMAMTVSSSDLRALAGDRDVVSLHEDGELQPGLRESVPKIGMNPAYTAGGTGTGTLVVIADTGAPYAHVFLTGRITNATCFSTNDATYATLCPNGLSSQIGGAAGTDCKLAGCDHGAHVAGIAAGSRTTGLPRNGVAKAATIMMGQVYTRRISDSALIARDSDLLAFLNDLLTRVSTGGELAARKTAAVNLSLWDPAYHVTGTCDSDARAVPFKTVFGQLGAQNVATVVMAGNQGMRDKVSFPGCISNAVTVSSTTKSDEISSFSNMSPVVELLAPGSDISSSVPPNPNFGVMSGTSMAAAMVTGAFASIRSACTTATRVQILAALKAQGLAVHDNRSSGTVTRPRIRVNLALNSLC